MSEVLSTQADRSDRLGGLIALAILISAGALWWVSQSPLLVLVFVAGVAVLSLATMAATRRSTAPRKEQFGAIDWSVTVAAIDRHDCAVAITDRANRLACANDLYRSSFGATRSPAVIEADGGALGALQRNAWRDGEAGADAIIEGREWRVTARRAGRAEDHLAWWFEATDTRDDLERLPQLVSGALGAMLSAAGIESALVGPDGVIRAAGPGFARRAAGDPHATMAGQEFVAQLRTDSRERIFFQREGRSASPLTVLHVPLTESIDAEAAAAAPVLSLLVEDGAGLGGSGAEDSEGPQLQGLLAALPLGLAMTDRDGRMLFANPAFRRATGIAEGAALPPYPSDLVTREDKPALADAVRRFARGPASSGDMAVRLRDAPEEPVSLGLAGVRGLGESTVLLSLADSSEETRLRRQVMQATKMQAVGQLAGGVAHDFNNVLTAIIGYCDLMLLRHTPGDSDYDDIQQIRANSNRAASLTRQLLAFSRQQTLRPQIIQLPDVVSDVSQLLKRLLGEKITLRVNHDRDLGPVRADPQQLEQVIVNLAVNARDAMLDNSKAGNGQAGQLLLATRRISASDIRRMDDAIVPIDDYSALVVEDTGGGIPAEVMPKIFEPFFTTKEVGKGTGLGLSTVYGIVKQSGGYIFVDTIGAEDKRPPGARFTLYFPVHRGAASDAAASDRRKASREDGEARNPSRDFSRGGRILLVEDEDMVRAVASRALERQGYAVVAAEDGEAALAAFTRGGTFDLVVSDVVMPGMDGPALARVLRGQNPKLPILFMSGYAEEQLRSEIDLADMHFIAKPFGVQAIAEKVAEVLNQSDQDLRSSPEPDSKPAK